MKTRTVCIGLMLMSIVGSAWAADMDVDAKAKAEELAKQTQNPVSSLISVPIMNNLSFGAGPEEDLQNTANIMAVYPQTLTEDWNWIHRVVVPFMNQPEPIHAFGLSDIQYQGYLSPQDSGAITWGVGPVLQMPTATEDELGTEKWSAGPGIVALQMNGPWVYGTLINQIWSFGGTSNREDVNLMFVQPFINYNLGGGLAIGTVPQIIANWEAQSSDVWTIPVGAQISKIVKFGKQPVNLIFGGYYNVEKPEFGADWMLRFQVQFLFPKS